MNSTSIGMSHCSVVNIDRVISNSAVNKCQVEQQLMTSHDYELQGTFMECSPSDNETVIGIPVNGQVSLTSVS